MSKRPQDPTIYQVAERAGVSISTVSLAINHPERVAAHTRARVFEAASELGYTPPTRAAGSAKQGRWTIVVVAPFSSWPSYSLRLGGMLERLGEASVDVVVKDVPATNLSQSPFLDALPIATRFDAAVVMGVPLSESAEAALAESRMPVLVVDASSKLLPSIVEDDRYDGELIGRHLATLGHRRVCFVHDHQESFDYVSAGMLRLVGAGSHLEDAGGQLTSLDLGELGADAALAEALAVSATAVIANNDSNAAQLMAAMRRRGLRAPDDLSVAGFDDSPLAEALGLTTVAQPFVESGRVAAAQLEELLQGQAGNLRRMTLSGTLIARSSTGPRLER